MEKPKEISIKIDWTDENDKHHSEDYSDIDEAMILLQLLNGDISEEDLKP